MKCCVAFLLRIETSKNVYIHSWIIEMNSVCNPIGDLMAEIKIHIIYSAVNFH